MTPSSLALSLLQRFAMRLGNADSIAAILESETRHPAPLSRVLQALDAAKRPLAASLRSQVLALKILNLLLCRHHQQARSPQVLSRPIGLILDPINACQMACPGCVHSQSAKSLFDWRPGRMSLDMAASLFRQYGPYAIQASFCNYGEPTLNEDTPRMISMAKRFRIRTTMSTNLARPRLRADEWVTCGLDFLIVSIDGITPGTYDVFRRNGNLTQALDNVCALVEAKRRLKLGTPVIHWQFLAFEHNKHEIPAAIAMARGLGVNQICIAHPFDVTWDDASIRAATGIAPSFHRFDRSAERWIADNERQFPLDEDRIEEAFQEGFGEAPDTSPQPMAHTCTWLYKNMTVDANGRVLPCCCAPRPDADLVMGKLSNETDPFNSPKYQAARNHFNGIRDAQHAPHCVQCTWQQDTAQIDRSDVRYYLRGVGAFSSDTLNRLTGW